MKPLFLAVFTLSCAAHPLPAARQQTARPARAPGSVVVTLPNPDTRIPAQDLEGGIAWLNTDRPLRMNELRGHVVIVDFWTYCCINCMHTLPILAEIEKRHAQDPVVVLGIHSAKFPGEREADRIAEAIQRYDIKHPVIVDHDNTLWDRWRVRAWPSLYIIDTEGRVVGVYSGEPTLARLDAYVNELLDEGEKNHTLASQRIALRPPAAHPDQPLSYPGKIVALDTQRFAFSDSGHHRIIVAKIDGTVEHIIGAGIPGREDGDFEHATFRHPQGIAFEPQPDVSTLYVADTENHEIRLIDLKHQSVQTLAGTGVLSREMDPVVRAAKDTPLRSPWDLVRFNDQLIVAMAGAHQLWSYSLTTSRIEPWIGSGAEDREDGTGFLASFAQPSGLARQDNTLFVADSETSSIRSVSLQSHTVNTLVGRALFTFGDVDGRGDVVRLQHPLGVAVVPDEPGVVYVADTYNHKIKRIDVATRTSTTLLGSSTRDPLFEPSGLTWTGSEFLVTDTNHHRIVRVSRDGRTLTPIVFRDLHEPTPQVRE